MRTRRSQSSSDPVSSGKSPGHRSVLLRESVDALDLKERDVVVDATLGGAGHAKEIVRRLGKNGSFIGFDLDADAISRAKEALSGAPCKVHLIEANFRNLGSELDNLSVSAIDKAIFDLGWSSYQLQSGRGFSFQKDEPLVMTYGKEGAALNAATIVNDWAESSISDVIFGWGEERYARRIARKIVEARAKKRIETSSALAEIIKAAVPPVYRFGRIHPATKTFQALRIAVNDELGAIEEGLKAAWERLSPSGRIAVITFHSIEDALVKRLFAEHVSQGATLIFKKPVRPSEEELAENPRARSAKLRVIQKQS